jgi:hypothetical protein
MPPDFDLSDPDAVAYCPACGYGYTARATRCAPCDVALIPRARVEAAARSRIAETTPMGDSALLVRLDEPVQANVLELELGEAGIPYLVQPWPLEARDYAGTPKLLEFRVPAERLAEAGEALRRVVDRAASP